MRKFKIQIIMVTAFVVIAMAEIFFIENPYTGFRYFWTIVKTDEYRQFQQDLEFTQEQWALQKIWNESARKTIIDLRSQLAVKEVELRYWKLIYGCYHSFRIDDDEYIPVLNSRRDYINSLSAFSEMDYLDLFYINGNPAYVQSRKDWYGVVVPAKTGTDEKLDREIEYWRDNYWGLKGILDEGPPIKHKMVLYGRKCELWRMSKNGICRLYLIFHGPAPDRELYSTAL